MTILIGLCVSVRPPPPTLLSTLRLLLQFGLRQKGQKVCIIIISPSFFLCATYTTNLYHNTVKPYSCTASTVCTYTQARHRVELIAQIRSSDRTGGCHSFHIPYRAKFLSSRGVRNKTTVQLDVCVCCRPWGERSENV